MYAFVSNCLIELDEPGRANYISMQEYREFAGWFLSHGYPCPYNYLGMCADSIVGEFREQVGDAARRYIGS